MTLGSIAYMSSPLPLISRMASYPTSQTYHSSNAEDHDRGVHLPQRNPLQYKLKFSYEDGSKQDAKLRMSTACWAFYFKGCCFYNQLKHYHGLITTADQRGGTLWNKSYSKQTAMWDHKRCNSLSYTLDSCSQTFNYQRRAGNLAHKESGFYCNSSQPSLRPLWTKEPE